MKYPVNYIGISQGYHKGKCLDFGWNANKGGKNQPIYAVDNGVVYSIENQPKGGNVIYIKHDDGKCSCYAHLEKVMVTKNERVQLGEQIGTMGKTGEASGNHLHFGLFKNVASRYKDSTLDLFEYLELYEDQEVGSTTQKRYGNKIKKHSDKKIYYVSTLSNLNVRKSKNLDKKSVINTLPTKTQVEVTEIDGNYAKIGDNQYVWKSYLKTKKPSKVYLTKVVTSDTLNVRVSPNGNLCKTNNSLPKGTIVAVMETKKGWTKIGKKRWVYSRYIK